MLFFLITSKLYLTLMSDDTNNNKIQLREMFVLTVSMARWPTPCAVCMAMSPVTCAVCIAMSPSSCAMSMVMCTAWLAGLVSMHIRLWLVELCACALHSPGYWSEHAVPHGHCSQAAPT